MSALSGGQMAAAGIVEGAADEAWQPNGCDLTVDEVERIVGAGALYVDGKTLPETRVVVATHSEHRQQDIWTLRPGAYVIRFAETVRLPIDVMGYLDARSTLGRIGASLHTGVVDAGYAGRMQCLMEVINPEGIVLAVGARVCQFSAHRMEHAAVAGYAGQYQGEGLPQTGTAEVHGTAWSTCPQCGGASDLEGDAPCARCDRQPLPTRAEIKAALDAQYGVPSRPRLDPRLIGHTVKGLIPSPSRPHVNPRLIVHTVKGLVPSFRRERR